MPLLRARQLELSRLLREALDGDLSATPAPGFGDAMRNLVDLELRMTELAGSGG